MSKQLEAWLSGPVEGVSPYLQPVAHSLIQVGGEVRAILEGFPDELLWERPADVAAVGFHLRHIAGVIDRLFTYARGDALSPAQFDALRAEAAPDGGATVAGLLDGIDRAVERALAELRGIDESELTAPREVGRARLPSTVLGLLSHAAEHSQRHMGQLLVTARVLHPRPTG